MESVLVLIFVGIPCLMFLGLLYGDRLSTLGIFDGDWFSPIGLVAGKIWTGLCEAVDVGIEFILAHLAWVVAAVSGTAGLVIVGFLMGGGLAADAAGYHRDSITPVQSGGVIDQVVAVATRTTDSPMILASVEPNDHLVSLVRPADYLVFSRPEYNPVRPRPRRPIDGSIEFPTGPLTEEPFLDVTFRRLGASVLRSESIPDVVTRGRLMDSLPNRIFIDRIVARLSRDDWRESIGLPSREPGLPQDTLLESSPSALRDLESRVRVTPGVYVSRQDLRVEKTLPQESATGEITIQLSVTNLGRKTIDGLIVRELLPAETLVRGAEPEAVFRRGTLTWLVDGLRPSEEQVVGFTVISPEGASTSPRRATAFESTTEVSAITAVAGRTEVIEEKSLPLPDPFPVDRSIRQPLPPTELIGVPELVLNIEEPTLAARVGDWTQILFTLTNRGTADAESIRLRLTLDSALDHSDLLDGPSDERQVFKDVSSIPFGQSRRFRLEVRPKFQGETISTSELFLDGARVDRQTFRLIAGDRRSPPPESSTTIR